MIARIIKQAFDEVPTEAVKKAFREALEENQEYSESSSDESLSEIEWGHDAGQTRGYDDWTDSESRKLPVE